uniref:Transmembrane channel like 6 n=1 Tax=Macaca fascicularis TaxID=9541 RepID=A0A7N9CNV9_MACFA
MSLRPRGTRAARSPAPTMKAKCTTPSTSSSKNRASGRPRRGWSCSRGSRRPQGVASRRSGGPRAPRARPHSASWPACPAAPLAAAEAPSSPSTTAALQPRRSSRPLLGNFVLSARPSLRLYDLELDPTAREEEEKQSLLVKELQSLAVAQRDHMLRGMPLSLAEKRSLREKSRTPRGKWRGQQGSGGVCSCCGRLRYACVLALHSLGLALLSGLQALTPWRYALKRIGGQFGSSVLSYFLFLKTLLAFNALLQLLLVAFIVGPQVAFPPALPGPAPICTGLELLTGAGCFTHTVMFYGHYSNATLNQPCGSPLDGSQCTPRAGGLPYNMPLAYLYTVGAGFFITCITLVYSMAHSFGESYRVGSTSGIHAITVFCSWDYKVTQKRASRLQQDNIRTRLKELLAEWQLRQSPRSVCGRLRQAAALGLAWLLCLGTALGCAVAIHVFSEFLIQVRGWGEPGPCLERVPSDSGHLLPGEAALPPLLHPASPGCHVRCALCWGSLPAALLAPFPISRLFFFRFLCFFSTTRAPPRFLCGLNLRPGEGQILEEGGAACQFCPGPLPVAAPSHHEWGASVTPIPTESGGCWPGGCAAGPAPGGWPSQPGGPLPVPCSGRPGAA